MAHEEHLASPKQGVKVWNQWREKNPEVRPNLNTADLSLADLSHANLSSADLSLADLSYANLSETIMSRTTIVDVDLNTANDLETVKHGGPSGIGIDTVYRSQGNIPCWGVYATKTRGAKQP